MELLLTTLLKRKCLQIPTPSRWDKFKSRAKLIGALGLGAGGAGSISGASQGGEGAVNVYVNRSTNIGKQHN